MDTLQYQGGPPPAEGWWPTRATELPDSEQEYRYWHGDFWSAGADAQCSEAQAELIRTLPSPFTDDTIRWRGWTNDERAGKAPQPELPNADLF